MYPRSSLEPHSLLTHRTTYNHFIFFFFSFHGCRYTLNDKIVSRTQRTETSSEQPRHTIQRSFSTERFPICRKTIGEHLHRGLFHARDRPLSLSLSLSSGDRISRQDRKCNFSKTRVSAKSARASITRIAYWSVIGGDLWVRLYGQVDFPGI